MRVLAGAGVGAAIHVLREATQPVGAGARK